MNKKGFVNFLERVLFPFLIILILGACASSTQVTAGSAAPNFILQAVRGGEYHLDDLLEKPVLLSFIDTQAAGGFATSDPSRAQIVFLKSMQEQYGPKGLVVLIIDAARIETGKQPSQDQLINFT